VPGGERKDLHDDAVLIDRSDRAAGGNLAPN
jgi:hypothetical protein